jgi:hypothetical protein
VFSHFDLPGIFRAAFGHILMAQELHFYDDFFPSFAIGLSAGLL